jgi:hypothetical protein
MPLFLRALLLEKYTRAKLAPLHCQRDPSRVSLKFGKGESKGMEEMEADIVGTSEANRNQEAAAYSLVSKKS